MLKLQDALNQVQALADKIKNYIEVFFSAFSGGFQLPTAGGFTHGLSAASTSLS